MKKKLPVYWGENPGRRLVGTAKIISSTEAVLHITDSDLLQWMTEGYPCSISIAPTDEGKRNGS